MKKFLGALAVLTLAVVAGVSLSAEAGGSFSKSSCTFNGKKLYGNIDAEVLAGIESGKFVDRPRRELVFAFWSLAHGFASLALVRRIKVKRVLVDPYVRQIVAPFVAGLRAL